jgi:hypothetical protein
MFSFDVSAIDIVLIVAIIVLLFLYSASKKSRASTTEKSHTPIIEKPYVPIVEKPYAPIVEESQVEEIKPLQEKHEVVSETFKSEDIAPKSSASPPNCVHNFGYLGSRPKNTPIPDECLGCPKVMQCLSQKE